ncbi:MAG: inorganic phosphate transporter, partial [Clostridia bacterium]|nr:inorganic phosphate transporter [Clostridia bacterium]
MSFSSWIEGVVSSPILLLLTLLTLGVIFVNGWTDAPNAIASCVATRALSPRTAIGMAAVCNFLGLILTVSVNSAVTDTVFTMVKFSDNEQESQIALCAAMAAIVLWACAAWYFGIPTSESHALIAGITGAALALGEEGGMRFSVWSRVLFGLAFSVISGFCLGWICVKIILKLAKNAKRDAAKRVLRRLQILSGAANAFLHGSQDGQKFIGVLLLSVAAAKH